MSIFDALAALADGQDLDEELMGATMQQIMTGKATDAQIGALLMGLRAKGETVTEITAAARVMRALATPVKTKCDHLVDTCGTGGDASGIFNVSTASAIVAAAAGAAVAKHGNRSVSSNSGSADLLEAAGVNLALSAGQVSTSIESIGLGFLFAPAHHGAMRHAIGPRKQLALRTIFNLLGPLTNPAGAPNQLLGVFAQYWVEPLARVLQQLGSRHVMVVHSDDGMDEISIAAPTHVAELKQEAVHCYQIEPGDFGLAMQSTDSLQVDNAQQSLELIAAALTDEHDAARDIVALNAGAACYVAGVAPAMADGVELAISAITSGRAINKLNELVRFSQRQ